MLDIWQSLDKAGMMPQAWAGMRYVTDVTNAPCNVHIVLTQHINTIQGKVLHPTNHFFSEKQVFTHLFSVSVFPMLSIKNQCSLRVTNWYLNGSIYHWSKINGLSILTNYIVIQILHIPLIILLPWNYR